MAAYLRTLIDENGNIIYPQSKAEAVYMSDNATNVEKSLNTKMNKINNTTAQFVAKDKIKINDVVYTVEDGIIDTNTDVGAEVRRVGLNTYLHSACFSPDGTKLVLGGEFTGYAKIYSVSDTTVTFVSNIYADAGTTAFNSRVKAACFSPDGSKLVLGGEFTGKAKIYSVVGTTVTFLSDIYADTGTTALNIDVRTACFSPDGSKLVLGGHFTGRAKIYSVSGTTITFVSNIYADTGTTALSSDVNSVCFSPDGSKLVLGGKFAGYAKVYSVSGTTVTFVSNIYADAGTTALNTVVLSVCFSPDGLKIVLGGNFAGKAKIYSVSGTVVTFVSNIYANAGATVLTDTVFSACFSSDGSKLVLGGKFTGYAKIYSVSGTTVAFISDIYGYAGRILNDNVNSACFSPDGSKLVLGGAFIGYANIYSVVGTTVNFISLVLADAPTTKISSFVCSACFSPDGSKLVLGGHFAGKAKIYSVSGTTITFVSNIYADTGTTELSSDVNSVCFSPDGSKLVLGGKFTGYAKVYSVSGTTVTFISNIYADAGTIVLNGVVSSVCFSPDGSKLVLGGSFTGRAKIYSVSGTGVIFISNIYADTGTTVLSLNVNSVCFSPDGTKLVLGGGFTGYAKIYSVSGTVVTFVSDIYADTGTTTLTDTVYSVCFSPDGAKLVLGGHFAGKAKIYSISGTTVTFISDIYADTGTTALIAAVYSVCFSPDGGKLVLGGQFSTKASLYSVSGTMVTFLSIVYENSGTTELDYTVQASCFSPDGTTLVLGGKFTGYAKAYSVSGTTVSYAPQKNYLTPNSAYTSLNAFSESSYFVGVSLSDANVNWSGFAELVFEGRKASFNDAALTGIPTAPTASTGTNTTQIATTEFVQQNSGLKVGDILTTTRTDLGDKYLLCNGDSVSETEYPELYSLLSSVTITQNGTVDLNVDGSYSSYANGYYFVIDASSKKIYYTLDSDPVGAWSSVQLTIPDHTSYDMDNISSVHYLNGVYIFCYGCYSGSSYFGPYVYYSTDLVTWSTNTIQNGSTSYRFISTPSILFDGTNYSVFGCTAQKNIYWYYTNILSSTAWTMKACSQSISITGIDGAFYVNNEYTVFWHYTASGSSYACYAYVFPDLNTTTPSYTVSLYNGGGTHLVKGSQSSNFIYHLYQHSGASNSDAYAVCDMYNVLTHTKESSAVLYSNSGSLGSISSFTVGNKYLYITQSTYLYRVPIDGIIGSKYVPNLSEWECTLMSAYFELFNTQELKTYYSSNVNYTNHFIIGKSTKCLPAVFANGAHVYIKAKE